MKKKPKEPEESELPNGYMLVIAHLNRTIDGLRNALWEIHGASRTLSGNQIAKIAKDALDPPPDIPPGANT